MDNELLRDDVLAELDLDPRVSAEKIGVLVDDGVVTLTGSVTSFADKWAAEEAVKRVKGVKAVAVRIDVDVPAMHQRNDSDIARAVADALTWDVTLPSAIQATVQNGYVTLEGTVDWYYQKQGAENTASRIRGVRGVTNLIGLRLKVSSTDVSDQIKRAFHRDAQLDANNIEVRTGDGKVMLHGNVHSWFEVTEAARAAWSVPGVHSVENHLQVALQN